MAKFEIQFGVMLDSEAVTVTEVAELLVKVGVKVIVRVKVKVMGVGAVIQLVGQLLLLWLMIG